MEIKKKVIEDETPCQRGCKMDKLKFSEIITTKYGNRNSIKIIYECIICGKKH